MTKRWASDSGLFTAKAEPKSEKTGKDPNAQIGKEKVRNLFILFDLTHFYIGGTNR